MTEKALIKKNKLRFGIISFAHMHASSYASALSEIPDAELVGIQDDNKDVDFPQQPGITAFTTIHFTTFSIPISMLL